MMKLDFAVEDTTAVTLQPIQVAEPVEVVAVSELPDLDYNDEILALDCYCQGIQTGLEALQNLSKLQAAVESLKGTELTEQQKRLQQISLEAALRPINSFQMTVVSLESIKEDSVSVEGIGSFIRAIWNAIVNTIKKIWEKITGLFSRTTIQNAKIAAQTLTIDKKMEAIEANPAEWEVDGLSVDSRFKHVLSTHLSSYFRIHLGNNKSVPIRVLIDNYKKIHNTIADVNEMLAEFVESSEHYFKFATLNVKDVIEEEQTKSFVTTMLSQFEPYYHIATKSCRPASAQEKKFFEDSTTKQNDVRINVNFTRDRGYITYTAPSVVYPEFVMFNVDHVTFDRDPQSRNDVNQYTITDSDFKSVKSYYDRVKSLTEPLAGLTKEYQSSLSDVGVKNQNIINNIEKIIASQENSAEDINKQLRFIFEAMKNVSSHYLTLLTILTMCQNTHSDNMDVVSGLLGHYKKK